MPRQIKYDGSVAKFSGSDVRPTCSVVLKWNLDKRAREART